MNTSVVNGRSKYWDNIKGILIFLVVFAHILLPFQEKYNSVNILTDFIYTFHVPVFVFVSGYFGKSDKSRSAESIIKLVVLYFIFNSLIGFIDGFVSLLIPMYSCWYLLALIVWRMSAPYISKIKWSPVILFIAALISGFYPDIDNTFSVARIICFYPFYMLGYMLSSDKDLEVQKMHKPKKYLVGSAALILMCLIGYFSVQFFKYSDEALVMLCYRNVYDCLGRALLFLVAVLAIIAFHFLSSDSEVSLITEFGRNSLWIFLFHRLFAIAISNFLTDLPMFQLLLAAFVSAIILCLVFGNSYVGKFMNKFISDGVGTFVSDEEHKINLASVVMICIFIWFIVNAFILIVAAF